MNGGYIMIYKSSKKIYLELFVCLTLGKPILWYEDETTCYFIDTISGGEISTEIVDDEEVRTYGDIILTKGGMTITITAENVVTEEGDIQPSSGGSSVVANPTLSGDEDTLEGLEVDGVKYAIPSGGGSLYQHDLTLYIDLAPTKVRVSVMIINDNNTAINYNSLVQFLSNNSMVNINTAYSASGFLMLTQNSVKYNYIVASIYASSGGTALTIESLDLANNARYEYAPPTTINVNDKIIQLL